MYIMGGGGGGCYLLSHPLLFRIPFLRESQDGVAAELAK